MQRVCSAGPWCSLLLLGTLTVVLKEELQNPKVEWTNAAIFDLLGSLR